MKKNKLAWVLGIFALAMIFYWGYLSGKSHVPEKEVKIGAILPMTGELAQLGQDAKVGLDFAEYYFNDCFPRKHKFRFVIEDGEGNPSKSISAYQKLNLSDEVVAMFSTISAVDMALLKHHKLAGLLHFSHSSHRQLSGVSESFFRHSNTIEQEVDTLLKECSKYDKIFAIASDDDYGRSIGHYLSLKSTKFECIEYPRETTDFSTIVEKINEQGNDSNTCIWICGSGVNLSNLVTKIRERGDSRDIYATIAYTVSGADVKTSKVKNLNLIQLSVDISDKFKQQLQEFENQENKKLTPSGLIFFNTAYILIDAIEKIGTNSHELAKYISDEKNELEGIGGKLEITSKRDILPNITIKRQ